MKSFIPLVLFAGALSIAGSGCASTPDVKTEAYAKLPDHHTFEYDFPTVWKGIELALKDHKITSRDPGDVDINEMRRLTKRMLQTDWIYGRSDTKYMEYKVNGLPQKQWLQTRYRFTVITHSVMGGVDVKIQTEEEIERLNSDGTSAGYSSVMTPDPRRASLLLDKINQALIAAPNTSGT